MESQLAIREHICISSSLLRSLMRVDASISLPTERRRSLEVCIALPISNSSGSERGQQPVMCWCLALTHHHLQMVTELTHMLMSETLLRGRTYYQCIYLNIKKKPPHGAIQQAPELKIRPFSTVMNSCSIFKSNYTRLQGSNTSRRQQALPTTPLASTPPLNINN
jgi:hypothetical protein